MFRRSTNLPARPLIPNKDEILDDLVNAPPDDVIYECNEENVSNERVKQPTKTHEEYENYEFEEGIKSAPYLKIDAFLDKINCLKNNLINLENQRTYLKVLEENLLQEMNHMKKRMQHLDNVA